MHTIKEIPLFSELTEEQLKSVEEQMLVRHYLKDSIVFYEGDESEYLYILLEGRVKLFKTSPKGTKIHMHNFAAPEMIALFPVLGDIPFHATCKFVTDGTMGLLRVDKLYDCLHNTDFALSLISSLLKRMNILVELLHKETIYSSEAKIADALLNNTSIFERLKNNEIASILNMTPETLSRILTKLKKEKIVTIEEHVVTIIDASALEEIIETNSMKNVYSSTK
ncbi:Crp/Fnr family transcriptional regulator [Sulfurovum sp. XGS-02]|uniref:Crp/Fnr family transcriptional regulator n=1 Tax=Sulfurovum sp. XGS-02 TaxID=2925411 RepID=UPI002046D859|nr:Crp/Fnr family transcriptional regulator [Sulfurovum sp. XGS-02]UPT77785.1 Crp/Fnr family transcriptional regulator [Sulfurovum sp. XGS-02]